jgi:hypothetical protein
MLPVVFCSSTCLSSTCSFQILMMFADARVSCQLPFQAQSVHWQSMQAVLPLAEPGSESPVWMEIDYKLFKKLKKAAHKHPSFYFLFTKLSRDEQRRVLRLWADADGSRSRQMAWWQQLDRMAAEAAPESSSSQLPAWRSRSRSSRSQTASQPAEQSEPASAQ